MKIKTPNTRRLIISTILSLLAGTSFYHIFEGWSWIDSIYFSVITLTTIGYGDLAPTTPLSKIFTMVYIFVGIGIIFGFIRLITRGRLSPPFRHKNNSKK